MSELEWGDIPKDIGLHVVHWLDFPARQALARCSKADRALVSGAPWMFPCFRYLVNRDSKKGMEVEHSYRMDIFEKNENGTLVEKKYRLEEETPRWTTKSETVVEDSDWQELASGRLNEMLKNQHYQVDEIEMDLHSKPPVFSRIVTVNVLKISAEIRPIPPDLLIEMMKSIRPSIDWLQFRLGFKVPKGLAELESVKKARRLVFSDGSTVTDEELLALEAHFLDIYSSQITINGINVFLHKRYDLGQECDFSINVSGDGRIDKGFECVPSDDRNESMSNWPKKFVLTKPGSEFVCYLNDLEGNTIRGTIAKRQLVV
ncbi:unnamed protein product [Caenorhabditis sp. 36 PRJEB53466]|nr:unnamed protein product [Caenorhabditis sp. 36 PRJEB53466]